MRMVSHADSQSALTEACRYSNIVVDVPGSEHAYDRLKLSDVAYDLCPPTYKIEHGKHVEGEPAANAMLWHRADGTLDMEPR
jgi:hypothetical protein